MIIVIIINVIIIIIIIIVIIIVITIITKESQVPFHYEVMKVPFQGFQS